MAALRHGRERSPAVRRLLLWTKGDSADSSNVSAWTAMKPLRSLRGRHLDTVAFIVDYVVFPTGGNVLRALCPPSITLPSGQRVTFLQVGTRDALCVMVETTVDSAIEVSDFELNFGWLDG